MLAAAASRTIPDATAPRMAFQVLLAVVGTIAYVHSFTLSFEAAQWIGSMTGVALGALAGWVGLGLALMIAMPVPIILVAWMNVCLAVMARGIAILMIGAGVNLCTAWLSVPVPAPGIVVLHVIVLLVSNVVMGWTFVVRARHLGVPRRTAVLLWVFALNGLFAVTLVTVHNLGG